MLGRLLRHRWWDETDTDAALGPQALDRLEERIAQSERLHGGEIRVCIEGGLPLDDLWREATPRARALELFGRLGVWDTEANNGVLIYVLLADQAIEIVADRGAGRYAPADGWHSVIRAMQDDFRAGRFEAGIMRGIDAVDALLVQHFPVAEGAPNRNELPNRPLML